MKELVDDLRNAIANDPDPWDVTLYGRAANEIERLRKLGDDMAYWYENLSPSMTMRDAVEAWKEARRG